MKISFAKFVIAIIVVVASIYLIEDLYFVLTSYGTWDVFMNKLFKATIMTIALIALINNKLGINTMWMHSRFLKRKAIVVSIIISIIIILIAISNPVQNYYKYKTTDGSEIACIKAGLGHLMEDEGEAIVCDKGTIWLEIDHL